MVSLPSKLLFFQQIRVSSVALRCTEATVDPDMAQTYTIQSPDGKTRFSLLPERGGTGHSLIVPNQGKEQELLHLRPFFQQHPWPDLAGGWPFLFPICGRLQWQDQRGHYLHNGKPYQLPIHGFSWQMPWQVENIKNNEITLVLTDNQKTRAMYPFHFTVRLIYSIDHCQLICRQTYSNNGEQPMPYYAGFHPYFLTPPLGQGKELGKINFQPIRCLKYNEQLTDIIGEAPLFHLPTIMTDPAINEQLTMLGENHSVELCYPDGLTAKMTASGADDRQLFSYLQLYTIPDQPFFCIEPWMSFPNAMNKSDGVRWLQPGQMEQGILTLEVTHSPSLGK